MWFPIDQPWLRGGAPRRRARAPREILELAKWKDDDVLPVFDQQYDEVCETLPPNFADDLIDKPDAQRQWRWDQQHGLWGYIDPTDTKAWLRHLDYYVKLHQMADDSLGTVLGALDESGADEDTIVIFTSDHGDMCGSHGLRSKGPFVYDEIMNVPLLRARAGCDDRGYADQRARNARRSRDARSSRSRASISTTQPSLRGTDLAPVLADPAASVRDHVLFAHDTAHTEHINQTRYAIRGFFDGQTKYARYYGVGGGKPGTGLWGKDPGTKLFDVDAAFDDQEHEWYDHDDDPHETGQPRPRSRPPQCAQGQLRPPARVRSRRAARVTEATSGGRVEEPAQAA